jgi:xylulokinase
VVGKLGARAAESLNLPAGTVAVTGGHDQTAGAFGCGIAHGGEAMYAIGTVECLLAVFDRIVTNEVMLKSNLCCYPHVVKDAWASIAFNFSGGSLLKWYKNNFNLIEIANARLENRSVYDVMLENIPEEPTGILVLPHFTSTGTPYMDPDPLGAIVGLRLDTSRSTIAKAILEGTTYEMKLNLDLLKSAGVSIERLRAIGGGSRSDAWLQIKADIMGLPIVRMQVTEAACLGAALCAGVATGVYSSADDAVKAACRTGKEFLPDVGRHGRYQELLAGYEELYGALKKVRTAIRNYSQGGVKK